LQTDGWIHESTPGGNPLIPIPSGRAALLADPRTDRPKLLAAAPIIAVYQELDQHVRDLMQLAPASDATTALTLYRDKLSTALRYARDLELFVSAEQAALVLGKSVSMVTYLCRTGALKAKKVGGAWQIDRLAMERIRDASREEEVSESVPAKR